MVGIDLSFFHPSRRLRTSLSVFHVAEIGRPLFLAEISVNHGASDLSPALRIDVVNQYIPTLIDGDE